MNTKKIWFAPIPLLVVLLSFVPGTGMAQEVSPPSLEEQAKLADMRSAGIRGDHGQLPAILEALKPEKGDWYHHTALRAAAELGAAEVLPALDTLIQKGDTNIANRARVVRARIVAETANNKVAASANLAPSPASLNQAVPDAIRRRRAQNTLTRFLKELSLSIEQIGEATKAQTQKPQVSEAHGGQAGLVELWAQEEIADMIYHGDAAAYLVLPDVQKLDFTEYPGAALKMKLAPMLSSERVKWLIDDLAKKQSHSWKEDYAVQLAVDEGVSAGRCAVAKLTEMKQNLEKYTVEFKGQKYHPGVGLMLNIISGLDEAALTEQCKQLQATGDADLIYYASRPYYKHQAAAGY